MVSHLEQEPLLDDGATVDDNIQPAVKRVRNMVADFEQARSPRRRGNPRAHRLSLRVGAPTAGFERKRPLLACSREQAANDYLQRCLVCGAPLVQLCPMRCVRTTQAVIVIWTSRPPDASNKPAASAAALVSNHTTVVSCGSVWL